MKLVTNFSVSGKHSHISTPMENATRFSSSISISISVISVVTVILMLLFIVILILIACKLIPWRRFRPSSAAVRHRRRAPTKDNDIERPLVAGDLGIVESQSSESTISYSVDGDDHQYHGNLSLSQSSNVSPKQSIPSMSSKLADSDSFVLQIPNASENSVFGQTLKHPITANQFSEDQICGKGEDFIYRSKHGVDKDSFRDFIPSNTAYQKSTLMLEVIAGPSRGIRYSIDSTNASKLPVTMGRVAPADILLKDSEVSGKHATINWNMNKLKWELVDMGSLNGTFLNSQAVHHHQSGNRQWGNPVYLSSGDTITLGTRSKIFIQIGAQTENQVPFGIGIASDPMASRLGGKKLSMEDVCFYQWPLFGSEQFGVFGICDGHGGADAATCVSKIMPEVISGILSDSFRREKVLSQCDASEVLRESFYQTEERINHYYEGCTATVLLVWADGHDNFYAQCANVGDSACVVNIDEKQIKMTEDHRITSHSERARFQAAGVPLRDGETRIGGLNLARMLGDKFLKEKDPRFSSEPYISEAVYLQQASNGFALLASDGFWDVVSIKKAIQLVHQTMEENMMERENSAEKIANLLLNEARKLRTKDNTTIMFLDFNIKNGIYSCKPHS